MPAFDSALAADTNPLQPADLALLRSMAQQLIADPTPHGRVSLPFSATTWNRVLRLVACWVHETAEGWVGGWSTVPEAFIVGSRIHVRFADRLLAHLEGRHAADDLEALLAALAAEHGIEVPA